jgi:hypothetical protein
VFEAFALHQSTGAIRENPESVEGPGFFMEIHIIAFIAILPYIPEMQMIIRDIIHGDLRRKFSRSSAFN